MTIKDNEGKVRLISNIENTAHDLAIYQPREIKVSEGDKIRFTRTVNEHGHVANSQWQVKRIEDNGAIVLQTMAITRKSFAPTNLKKTSTLIWDMPLPPMVRKGASSTYAIELQAIKGVNRNLITLSSAYVPASRAKEHMQTYTDDKEGWINLLNKTSRARLVPPTMRSKATRLKGRRSQICYWVPPRRCALPH